MNISFCCVIGHRKIDITKRSYVKAELKQEIKKAIQDGYTNFISGFSPGTDLMFADIIVELQRKYPINLIAYIPYVNIMKTKNRTFQNLIYKCNSIKIYSEYYAPFCFIRRSQLMVQNSRRVIAVYDGRQKGGTINTINYARKLGRDLKIIEI
ncbi:DUF1273 domain-containing protein [Selenomonadales bacterium OttesenSCG-928-I06]|nr:DUF1273 domain-containing protein [Selenomonadales bacterium OttesenSCG-928-I06]